MTSAITCIIILACTVTLTSSAGPIIECRCLNTPKGVRVPVKDIVSATDYPPRPYCTRKEVIITLTNGRSVCLNPTERYTKAVLKRVKKRDAAKNTTASKATTETATATVSETKTTTTTETATGPGVRDSAVDRDSVSIIDDFTMPIACSNHHKN